MFQNTETSHFNFLFIDVKAPRWLWLLGVFLAGFAAGLLFSRHRSRAQATN